MSLSEYCYRMVWRSGFTPDVTNIVQQYMEIFRCHTHREVEEDLEFYLKDQEHKKRANG